MGCRLGSSSRIRAHSASETPRGARRGGGSTRARAGGAPRPDHRARRARSATRYQCASPRPRAANHVAKPSARRRWRTAGGYRRRSASRPRPHGDRGADEGQGPGVRRGAERDEEARGRGGEEGTGVEGGSPQRVGVHVARQGRAHDERDGRGGDAEQPPVHAPRVPPPPRDDQTRGPHREEGDEQGDEVAQRKRQVAEQGTRSIDQERETGEDERARRADEPAVPYHAGPSRRSPPRCRPPRAGARRDRAATAASHASPRRRARPTPRATPRPARGSGRVPAGGPAGARSRAAGRPGHPRAPTSRWRPARPGSGAAATRAGARRRAG